jgi:hypothetical protein
MKVQRKRWAVSLAVTVSTVAAGMLLTSTSHAAEPPDYYSTSSAVQTQSMVKGSSPTSLGDSPLAQTAAGKAAALATTYADVPADRVVTSSATLVLYDPRTKAVTYRHRYGAATEGRRIAFPRLPLADHGTGGGSSASGCGKVIITQKLHDTLGLSAIGTWKIFTDWCWTRSNQVVSIVDTGVSQDHDQTWSYDGVLTEFNENHFYDFSVNDGHPRSAYLFVRQAKFHGPCLSTSFTCQWTPKNSLASYYNGTWQWWTSS